MEEFGIRFKSSNEAHFSALRRLFLAIKKDKDDGTSRSEKDWIAFVPKELRANFIWPNEAERAEWLYFSRDKPVSIPDETSLITEQWNFYCIVDAFHNGDYDLLRCEKVNDSYEMHIYPFGYPYGGIGPLIALAEGFGFKIEGVNVYGKYLDRSELNISG